MELVGAKLGRDFSVKAEIGQIHVLDQMELPFLMTTLPSWVGESKCRSACSLIAEKVQ